MSNALTVPAPSPQPANPSMRYSRRGSDEPSNRTTGFDALLADHAAPAKPPKADAEPALSAQRQRSDRRVATHAAGKGAKAGHVVKRTLPDAAQHEDGTVPKPADGQAAPTADPADATTGDPVTQGSVTGAPATAGLGAVPVPSTPVPSTTSPTASGTADTVGAVATGGGGKSPNAGTADTGPREAPNDGVVVLGGVGPDAPTAGTPSPGQPVDAAGAAKWSQPNDGAAGPAGPLVAGLGVLSAPVQSAAAPAAPGPVTTGQPAASWIPAAAHQQVFTAVSPLLRGEDGSYGIQLNLHPKDLGSVQVTVDVRHGEIAIQMHAADPAAREALRSGLSDLRQQLEDQGLRAGSMEVGSGGADARQPDASWSRSPGIQPPGHGLNPSDQLVATAVAASTTALDLRM